jgi:translation elongation factor EF-Tu-like GTPase
MGSAQHPPDIEAEIYFLPTEQGGRHSAAPSGYRAPHDFGLNGMLNDAMHEYSECESVAPGKSAKANMWFLAPEYQHGRLHSGFEFTVQEGSRVVGRGIILRVVNPVLRDGT